MAHKTCQHARNGRYVQQCGCLTLACAAIILDYSVCVSLLATECLLARSSMVHARVIEWFGVAVIEQRERRYI